MTDTFHRQKHPPVGIALQDHRLFAHTSHSYQAIAYMRRAASYGALCDAYIDLAVAGIGPPRLRLDGDGHLLRLANSVNLSARCSLTPFPPVNLSASCLTLFQRVNTSKSDLVRFGSYLHWTHALMG